MPTFLQYNKKMILFEFETLHIIQHSVRYDFYHVTKDVFFDNENYADCIKLSETIFDKSTFVQNKRK